MSTAHRLKPVPAESGPPHSIAAEQAVIGGLLLEPAAYESIADVCIAADFYRPDHRVAFAAIAERAKAGRPFGAVLLEEELELEGKLLEAGGRAYLKQLAVETAGTANIRAYAETVAERARLRRLLELGAEMERGIAGGASSAQIVEALRPTLETLHERNQRAERAGLGLFDPKRAAIGMQTFTETQPPPEFIVEGLFPRDIGARAGAGGTAKTTVALWEAIQIVMGWRLYGREVLRPGKVLFVSAEDDLQRIRFRLRMLCEQLVDLSTAAKRHIADSIHVEDLTGKGVRLVQVDHDGNLVQTPAVDALIDAYSGAGISLVHFDPLVYFGPGERFVNDAEAALAQAAHRIRNGLNCAVMFTHHTGKANAREGRTDQYSARGGSALPDGMRFVQVLNRLEKADETTPADFTAEDFAHGRVLALHVAKLTDAPRPAAPIWIRRTGWRFEHVLAEQSDRQDLQRERIRRLYAFIEAQAAGGIRHSARSLETAAKELGFGRNELRSTLHAATELGHLAEHPLPASEQRGRRKSYLATGVTP